MREVTTFKGTYPQETYSEAMDTDRLLGAERPMFFVPGAGQQTLGSKAQKWTQWGPFLICDEFYGWYDEALDLRRTAVIGDWSPINKFNLTGPDVHAYVQYLQTRGDVKNIEIGQSMYTLMTREDGMLVHDPLITRTGEDSYRITPDQADKWLAHVAETGKFDVQIEDIRTKYALFSLQGPNSTKILNNATNEPWDDVKFSRFKISKIAGVELEINRQGFTGEVGYELMVGAADANTVLEHLVKVGKAHGIGWLGNYTSRLTRAEAGLVMLHFDYQCAFDGNPGILRRNQLDPAMSIVSPFELNLDYLVHLKREDDFVGKAALQKIMDNGGPAKRMKGLIWNPDDVAELFAAQFRDAPSPPPIRFPHPVYPEAHDIMHGGGHVGWATSVCYSPTLRRVFSYGRMNTDLCVAGNEVTINWGGRDGPTMHIRAEVVDTPFVSKPDLKIFTNHR
jgi:glycine cleavage system aminomethyltransferase T